MSMEESKARLKNSRKPADHFRWDGKDLVEFFLLVEELGPANVWIDMHHGRDISGKSDMHFVVTTKAGTSKDHHEEFNYSHLCPDHPDCPEGGG